MVSVSDIISKMEFALDAEGSDRYTFENDYQPAINLSIDWLVAVFNSVFAQKKLSEESLRDLKYCKIFTTNNFSRFKFDPLEVGHKVWTDINVIADNPNVYPEGIGPPLIVDNKSVYMDSLSYIGGGSTCNRITDEQVTEKDKNIFTPGNGGFTNDLTEWAYLSQTSFNATQNGNNPVYQEGPEYTIAPEYKGKFVAFTYLKVPDKVSDPSDSVEFPESITMLLVNKALNYTSFKQGDGTNLYSVTAQDISTLVNLML